jgi:hypothetical protein
MARRFEVIRNDLVCKNTGDFCPAKQDADDVCTRIVHGLLAGDPALQAASDEAQKDRGETIRLIDENAYRYACLNECSWFLVQASVDSHPAIPGAISKVGRIAARFFRRSD